MAEWLRIEPLLRESGYGDFRWLAGNQLPVRRWVRFKCHYGCPNFGTSVSCPPEVPSLQECREFFSEYACVAILRLQTDVKAAAEEVAWLRRVGRELLALERAVFRAGFDKAMVLFPGPCRWCDSCSGTRRACRRPAEMRPSPEALGVDVFGAVRLAGFEESRIAALPALQMARFAFLLVL